MNAPFGILFQGKVTNQKTIYYKACPNQPNIWFWHQSLPAFNSK
ncbi:MAG: hypothetical protein ACTSVI_04495 [Promethearchaeota archaeon]